MLQCKEVCVFCTDFHRAHFYVIVIVIDCLGSLDQYE